MQLCTFTYDLVRLHRKASFTSPQRVRKFNHSKFQCSYQKQNQGNHAGHTHCSDIHTLTHRITTGVHAYSSFRFPRQPSGKPLTPPIQFTACLSAPPPPRGCPRHGRNPVLPISFSARSSFCEHSSMLSSRSRFFLVMAANSSFSACSLSATWQPARQDGQLPDRRWGLARPVAVRLSTRV